ncbi:MAG: hypothetical protein ABMA64_40505, partial [Myxococcota bacterium]
QEEADDLLRRIRRGASVSLAAPRRVGKTSLLHEVRRRLEEEGTATVFVDLEGAESPEDAIAEIAAKAESQRALAARARGWVGWLLGATPVDLQMAKLDLREALKVDWQTRGSRLFAELCAGDEPVVLFLDELPVVVASLLAEPARPGRSTADLLLSWLRQLVQEHRSLRIVITGSIGLAPLVERAGLSATLNVYETTSLGPWSPPIATQALHALAAYDGLVLGDGAAQQVVEELGLAVPYHVQLVHQALAEDARRRSSPHVSRDDVRRVWTERVLTRPSADLPHWEQRLRRALSPPDYALAVRLLTEAAVHEPLAVARAVALADAADDPQATVRAVLATLEHDGYLGRTQGGWYFPNRLLRAWWSDRHGPFA